MSTPNPNNFIVFKNENNETINYTYSSSYTNNSITYHITIDKTSNTVGTNTLTVTVNGYTETATFEFEYSGQRNIRRPCFPCSETLPWDSSLKGVAVGGAGGGGEF